MALDKDKPKKGSGADDLIDWFTVSYRSIYIAVGGVLVLAAGFSYWYWKSHPVAPPPTAETSPVPASTAAGFEEIEGSVQVKKAGTLEWIPATKRMALNQDDRVRTGSGAGAAIHLTSGIVYRMRGDSLLTIEGGSVDPGTKRQVVTAALQSGGVNFSTGGSSATIATPVSRTTAGQNSRGEVAVGQSGESVTKMFLGSATTESAKGDRVDLVANESVTVDASGKSGPKVPLPGVPVLMAPPHQAEISYVNPAVALTLLVWKPVPTATTYHVLVDYTQSFTRPLVDQKGWKPSSMELRGLEVGKYYWRVTAVDASGLEGSPSELSLFSVTKPNPGQGQDAPPSLSLETIEPKSNILHVKGRTEPGVSLTVNGQRVDVQSDGSFNEFITLEKPGKQVVVIRATSIGGVVNEQKRPVVVTY